ncbi:MAG: tRNA uridine(34) 5-carboxymethylaminomethyl modification radical SAM/GNAT enzyme Elp3 [Thermoplasmata archaeon]
MDYFEEFLQAIVVGGVKTRDEVLRLKARLCSRHGMARVPTNHEILARVPAEYREIAEPLLMNKPVRTLSGVAPVAVMTSPYDCPHGRCIYCPGGVPNNTPQSYTGKEPAARRAGMYDYDPFRQTKARLEQLRAIGHRTDKVDLIIMGGTFTSRPEEYQYFFVKRCFDAMNGFDSADLSSAQKANERAASRCVGLTVETRPDWFGDREVSVSLALGATKVELGVQTVDDTVLEGVKRGHGVKEVVEATRRAKDAGLKLAYHLMPGLPGSSFEKDLESFRTIIEDESFRPDMLKIYPTLVIAGTGLHDMWREGAYQPMSLERTVELLALMKRMVPPWIRRLRGQRDIPAQLIEAGVRKGHLRELVLKKLREDGASCRCIRCREIGHIAGKGAGVAEQDVEMRCIVYRASGGTEHFVSFDVPETDSLIGYARLRIPDEGEIALLRELHVYGQMVPISEPPGKRWQHKRFGERLLIECENIASSHGRRTMRVTSGVGAREYYRRLGYQLDAPYMSKRLP